MRQIAELALAVGRQPVEQADAVGKLVGGAALHQSVEVAADAFFVGGAQHDPELITGTVVLRGRGVDGCLGNALAVLGPGQCRLPGAEHLLCRAQVVVGRCQQFVGGGHLSADLGQRRCSLVRRRVAHTDVARG